MDEIYESMLKRWAELKAQERKYRALYNSRNDSDYLSYVHDVEAEIEKLEKVMKQIEEDL